MNKQDNIANRPNPKDAMKNRLPANEMKKPIEEFLSSQKELYIALNNQTSFPDLEVADYRYVAGKFILVLTPASMFLNKLETGTEFSGFIFDKNGHGLKMTKRVHGKFTCKSLATDAEILKEIAKTDEMVKRMLNHGAKFFELEQNELTVVFGGQEIFTMDNEMNPSFAKFAPNGRERFENSRHVLMEYLDRSVIFSVIVEDGTYYCLAKSNSNKMTHIKNGEPCKFFDGKHNHFEAVINIVDEKKDEIFEKLVATNNAFFKENIGLTALSFTKVSK